MSTLRQIEANRRNAQKSTGPTSVTGKAASSMNALKTGIHAKSLLLPTEDPAELDELVEDSYRSFHPTTPEARSLVDEFIYCEWSLRRLRAAETQSWQHQDHTAYSGPDEVPPRILRHPPREHLLQTPVPHGRHPPRPRTRPPVPQTTPGRSRRRPCRARPAPRTARTRRTTVPNPLTPNHFARNWLRSANPLRNPRPGAALASAPAGTRRPRFAPAQAPPPIPHHAASGVTLLYSYFHA